MYRFHRGATSMIAACPDNKPLLEPRHSVSASVGAFAPIRPLVGQRERVLEVNGGVEFFTPLLADPNVLDHLACKDQFVSWTGYSSVVSIWRLDSGRVSSRLQCREGVSSVLSLPGSLLAVGLFGTIEIYDLSSGTLLHTVQNGGQCMAALADGSLASGAEDGTIAIIDPKAGSRTQTLERHTDRVLCVVQLPDGRLASGSMDSTVRIWQTGSGTCQCILTGHALWVNALCVLSDGRLASGSSDMTIRVWDTHAGRCDDTLVGHTGSVTCLAVSGTQLISGSYEMKVWNMEANKSRASSSAGSETEKTGAHARHRKQTDSHGQTCRLTLAHDKTISCLCVLSDGAVMSASDYKVVVWR